MHHVNSTAGDGGDEDDFVAVVDGGGPRPKFAIHRGAEAIDRKGETVLRLQLFVERLGVDGLRAELLFGVTALFAQDGEIFNRKGFHASLW